MTRIRGVIFDMDGVLIDARDWHYEALNKALKLFGFQVSRFDARVLKHLSEVTSDQDKIQRILAVCFFN